MENDSPTVIERTLRAGVDAVFSKPIRPTGLLGTLAHAYHAKSSWNALEKKNSNLQRKLQEFRQVEKAKEFLMKNRNIGGDEAFAILRRYAMSERRTVEAVATGILDAERLLHKKLG